MGGWSFPTNFTAAEGQRGFALSLGSELVRVIFGDCLKLLFYEVKIGNL